MGPSSNNLKAAEAKSEIRSVAEAKLARGARVLVRVDFNVPCASGVVENDFRIRRALPTLELLHRKGCRTVIVSHLDKNSGETLKPVADYLAQRFPTEFSETLKVAEARSKKIKEGAFLLVENIRREDGETTNDTAFAHRLAKLGDIYINEAFAVSHREHASIIGVPKLLPSYAGFLLLEETDKLTVAFNPPKGSLFVLGGVKFETKLPLVKKFLARYERVFIGGALANDIFQSKGLEVGMSLVSPSVPDIKEIASRSNLLIPPDVSVKREGALCTVSPQEVVQTDHIVDVGVRTTELLKKLIREATFILWNGPLGVYEEGFTQGTERFARAVAESGVQSIVGGGDTVAAIEKLGLIERFGFISTGGGAMLEFLADETLVGIEALQDSKDRVL